MCLGLSGRGKGWEQKEGVQQENQCGSSNAIFHFLILSSDQCNDADLATQAGSKGPVERTYGRGAGIGLDLGVGVGIVLSSSCRFPCQAAFHAFSAIDTGRQFVVESAMTILQRTGRYIFFLSVFMLLLQVTAVTAENRKDGVTVSYESSGTSRVARFKNSNSYHVRVEFSYSGTKVHGSAETSGQGAVFVPANYSATYGGQGNSITSVRITRVMRSD
jgi:hypothetical protein